jgi:hypothetical protein
MNRKTYDFKNSCSDRRVKGGSKGRHVHGQGADKNIDELLEDFHETFHPLCQSGMEEELFDAISGFEALNVEEKRCALA